MTDEQKSIVVDYRKQGLTYTEIAQATGLKYSAIQYYLRVNAPPITPPPIACKHCGKVIYRTQFGNRCFCSLECRYNWKRSHLREHHYICQCCGKTFTVNQKSSQKYCSHRCYITARYGKKKRQRWSI